MWYAPRKEDSMLKTHDLQGTFYDVNFVCEDLIPADSFLPEVQGNGIVPYQGQTV
jgi:hypothetical protein